MGGSNTFVGVRKHASRPVASAWAARLCVALALLASGCATFVSSYDQDSVDRTTAISKSVLSLYQDLLATPAAERKAAVNGTLGKRQGDVETELRLHLLREQARQMNDESIEIAKNLLQSWQTFSKSHREGDATALADATLEIERGTMERQLGAAFKAEEAKKLAAGATK
jgi:hypothetical protein